MVDTVQVIAADPSPSSVEIPVTQAEAIAADDAAAEHIETVADSAVEIAQIEADRDVAVAEIHAETEQAHIQARADHEERDEEWRTETTHLREGLAALGEAVTAMSIVVEQLAAQSTPPASQEPDLILRVEEPETLTETTDTSGTPAVTSVEIKTEVPEKSEDEKPVAKRRLRMI